MSSNSILVTGATGRLGRLIVRRLLELGHPVRALTRRPEVAASLFGSCVEIAEGEFADGEALRRALTSVDRVLLLSPISEQLSQNQIAVLEAAERAGVQRIVKISGSDWTIDPAGHSISGAAHQLVEQRLGDGTVAHVSLRPNAWMQVGLALAIEQMKADGQVVSAHPDAPVSFIDARDIADVAVQQLLADDLASGPQVLTGAAAFTLRQVAELAAERMGRSIEVVTATRSGKARDFEQRAVAEFQTLIAEHRAAPVSDAVSRLLGRPPRTLQNFLAEHLEAHA